MKTSSTRRAFLGKMVIGGPALSSASILAQSGKVSDRKAPALPRCRILPLPDQQVSLLVDDQERVRWHFGRQYPRPFFFPLRGPSGAFLTRMGHPGAPNHDHHRSIWFAHHDVEGIDFWSDNTSSRIRQKQWLCYRDDHEECQMAVQLGWFGGQPEREIMEQTLAAVLRPGGSGETFLELQSTFRPSNDPVRLGKTNFGLLAVRVAKSISEHFGGGRLTNSEGRTGEAAIFGRQASWMDYSGPVPGGDVEGITYFDHPANDGHPTHWHVREDGWMGASFCMHQERLVVPEQPLKLRYLMHAHGGAVDAARADVILKEYSQAPFFEVVRSQAKHNQYELRTGEME